MALGIGSLSGLSPEAPRTDRATESKQLGQQDFLQLMIAQMKNQNPLEPQDQSQFIGQIAQFSMLDQIKSLNESILALSLSANFSQASAMLGKIVLAKGAGTDNTVLPRLEPKQDGVLAAISGSPTDDRAGTWSIHSEADGKVTAVFKPAGAGAPIDAEGQFSENGTLSDLIPGLTLHAKTPHGAGDDTVIMEPVFGGVVERIIVQEGKPTLVVGGELVNLEDVLEVAPGGSAA